MNAAPAKKGRKRIAGQTEMLLPIPGKKGKEVAAGSLLRAQAPGKRRRVEAAASGFVSLSFYFFRQKTACLLLNYEPCFVFD